MGFERWRYGALKAIGFQSTFDMHILTQEPASRRQQHPLQRDHLPMHSSALCDRDSLPAVHRSRRPSGRAYGSDSGMLPNKSQPQAARKELAGVVGERRRDRRSRQDRRARQGEPSDGEKGEKGAFSRFKRGDEAVGDRGLWFE